jgi:hypothetical protein
MRDDDGAGDHAVDADIAGQVAVRLLEDGECLVELGFGYTLSMEEVTP